MSSASELSSSAPPSKRFRPWLSRAFTVRYPLLVAWGTFWLVPPNSYSLRGMNDWIPFEIGARTLVHYHHMWEFSSPPLHLYADTPMLQFGPLPILLLAPFQVFSPHAVALGFGIAMVVAGLASMAALESAARTVVAPVRHPSLRRYAFAVEAVVVPIWAIDVGYWHHLDDVLALLCVCVAVLLVARQGPWWAIGLLVGTAAATKPWAVIFVPIWLALPRRDWGRTALVTMAAAAAWWLPFVVAAPDTVPALGQFDAFPKPGSVLYLLGDRVNNAGWLRPLQLGVGMCAVGLLSRRGRWTHALLVGSAVRLLLDPFAYSYYIFAPLLGALLVDFTRLPRTRLPRWTVAALLLAWLPVLLSNGTILWHVRIRQQGLHTLGAVARLAWVLLIVIGLALEARTASRIGVAAEEPLDESSREGAPLSLAGSRDRVSRSARGASREP